MNRILIVFLALVCCSLAADDDTKCQKSGEYCLNHWDCCSNTCLSFLYKCSNINAPDARPFSSPVLSNRIAFDSPTPDSSSPETLTFESLIDIIFSPMKTQPTAVGREINSIVPRVGEDEGEIKKEEEVIKTTTSEVQCLEIGSKCFTNEECCTKRCHGYLHQCVT